MRKNYSQQQMLLAVLVGGIVGDLLNVWTRVRSIIKIGG